MRRTGYLLATTASLALAACSDTAMNQWRYAEAGSGVDEGGFGNPTMNNSLVMTGKGGAILGLSRRFAAEVPTTINFAFDSYALDAQARAILARQADWIRQFPEVRFRVYGHTDLVGSDAYNKALGLRRAHAAVNFLVAQGISRSRLEAVVSFGETQPLIVTEGREPRNRRTVTDVVGWSKPVPQHLDGLYAHVIYRAYVQGQTISGPATN
jgi:outer membrane protein OmpA-like peptidoglycan-associated protein